MKYSLDQKIEFGIIDEPVEPGVDYFRYPGQRLGKRLDFREIVGFYHSIAVSDELVCGDWGSAGVFDGMKVFLGGTLDRPGVVFDPYGLNLLPPESAGLLAGRIEPWRDEINVPELIALLERARDGNRFVIAFGI